MQHWGLGLCFARQVNRSTPQMCHLLLAHFRLFGCCRSAGRLMCPFILCVDTSIARGCLTFSCWGVRQDLMGTNKSFPSSNMPFGTQVDKLCGLPSLVEKDPREHLSRVARCSLLPPLSPLLPLFGRSRPCDVNLVLLPLLPLLLLVFGQFVQLEVGAVGGVAEDLLGLAGEGRQGGLLGEEE